MEACQRKSDLEIGEYLSVPGNRAGWGRGWMRSMVCWGGKLKDENWNSLRTWVCRDS